MNGYNEVLQADLSLIAENTIAILSSDGWNINDIGFKNQIIKLQDKLKGLYAESDNLVMEYEFAPDSATKDRYRSLIFSNERNITEIIKNIQGLESDCLQFYANTKSYYRFEASELEDLVFEKLKQSFYCMGVPQIYYSLRIVVGELMTSGYEYHCFLFLSNNPDLKLFVEEG